MVSSQQNRLQPSGRSSITALATVTTPIEGRVPPPPPKVNSALEPLIQRFLAQTRYKTRLEKRKAETYPRTVDPEAKESHKPPSILTSSSKSYPARNMASLDLFAQDFNLKPKTSLFPCQIPNLQTPLGDCTYLTLRRSQNSDWANSIVKEGMALEKRDNVPEALAKYKAALDVDSKCIDALKARAICLFNRGDLVSCLRDLERILVIDPSHVQAANLLAAAKKRKSAAAAEMESAKRGEFLLSYDGEVDGKNPSRVKRTRSH